MIYLTTNSFLADSPSPNHRNASTSFNQCSIHFVLKHNDHFYSILMVRGVQSLARMDFFFLSGCVNLRLCSQIFGAFFYFFFEATKTEGFFLFFFFIFSRRKLDVYSNVYSKSMYYDVNNKDNNVYV